MDFNTWCDDVKTMAIKARRFAHANSQLPSDEADKALSELLDAERMFSEKHGVDRATARIIACSVSETCNLGLAY